MCHSFFDVLHLYCTSIGQKGKYRNAVIYDTEDLDGGLKLQHYITGIIGNYFFEDTYANGTYEKKYTQ